MWIVDPVPGFEGNDCLLCKLDGKATTARFRDPFGADICEGHFISMVKCRAVLTAHAHEDPSIHLRNRRKCGPGGRASAAAKRRRRNPIQSQEAIASC
jgi:hypothetical protein